MDPTDRDGGVTIGELRLTRCRSALGVAFVSGQQADFLTPDEALQAGTYLTLWAMAQLTRALAAAPQDPADARDA
jgi:hypothetical protein